jgi:hypothetical protein
MKILNEKREVLLAEQYAVSSDLVLPVGAPLFAPGFSDKVSGELRRVADEMKRVMPA